MQDDDIIKSDLDDDAEPIEVGDEKVLGADGEVESLDELAEEEEEELDIEDKWDDVNPI